jgi:hypothetical protein
MWINFRILVFNATFSNISPTMGKQLVSFITCSVINGYKHEMLEVIRRVIGIRKSKKERQYNDRQKNDLEKLHRKRKIHHESH